MNMRFNVRVLLLPLLSLAAIGLIAFTPKALSADNASDLPLLDCGQQATLYCPTSNGSELHATLTNLPTPTINGPVSPIAKPESCIAVAQTKTVTYQIETRGNITADLNQFKAQVAETYNDQCGWGKRLGVLFKEVPSGGTYSVVLAEASEVPGFGSPCDSQYSCRVGRYVIINQDRWLNATTPWNNAGGDIRNYRHMVVNHETGHWLGHGHSNCGGAGQPATVMQQQSIDLQGCRFNPWPLDGELWSTTLGI